MGLGTKVVLVLSIGVVAGGAAGWRFYRGAPPGIELRHAPGVFAHRAPPLSANVTGVLSGRVRAAEYRLNEGAWRPIGRGLPRAAAPGFIVEMPASDLRPGRNRVELRALGVAGALAEIAHSFDYDPRPIALPLRVDWRGDLEAQDGEWESLERDGETWVRPRPGREDYDRLLLASGAIAGGRRIRGSLVVRWVSTDRYWGCGILSLWGGHPDDAANVPRRGWRFGLTWYYNHYDGVGVEFSDKQGGGEARWVHAYRAYDLRPGVRHQVLVECWPELDEAGRHTRWRQRAKWWPDGKAEPAVWLETTDVEGSPLPAGDYAVAVVAHRCQVEFGALTIEALPARNGPAAAAGR
jgi:hypothetical protein